MDVQFLVLARQVRSHRLPGHIPDPGLVPNLHHFQDQVPGRDPDHIVLAVRNTHHYHLIVTRQKPSHILGVQMVIVLVVMVLQYQQPMVQSLEFLEVQR